MILVAELSFAKMSSRKRISQVSCRFSVESRGCSPQEMTPEASSAHDEPLGSRQLTARLHTNQTLVIEIIRNLYPKPIQKAAEEHLSKPEANAILYRQPQALKRPGRMAPVGKQRVLTWACFKHLSSSNWPSPLHVGCWIFGMCILCLRSACM